MENVKKNNDMVEIKISVRKTDMNKLVMKKHITGKSISQQIRDFCETLK